MNREDDNKQFIENLREFFDELITQEWDTYIDPHWDKTRQVEIEEVLRIIPRPKSILDVGCG